MILLVLAMKPCAREAGFCRCLSVAVFETGAHVTQDGCKHTA